jgi:queuine tRNA-ribosyltransferase
MGVGRPEDIVEAVRRGIDMFDCVMPTRNARNGHLLHPLRHVRIRNARTRRHRADRSRVRLLHLHTLQRAYLRHLDRCNEILGAHLGRCTTCTTTRM